MRVERPHAEVLRNVAIVFLVALLVHGFDHTRRGFDVVTDQVFWLGNLQLTGAVIAGVLAVRRHRWAPLAAMAIGVPSAVGFTAVHLLPHWSALSDSFTGAHVAPHVTALSWFAALFEIAGDVALAATGLWAWRQQRRAATPASVFAT